MSNPRGQTQEYRRLRSQPLRSQPTLVTQQPLLYEQGAESSHSKDTWGIHLPLCAGHIQKEKKTLPSRQADVFWKLIFEPLVLCISCVSECVLSWVVDSSAFLACSQGLVVPPAHTLSEANTRGDVFEF